MKKLFFLTTICGLSLLGCNRTNSTSDKSGGDPQLFDIKGDSGNPKSIFLWITDKTELDSVFRYQVLGLYKGDTVGFFVSLDKDIPAGIYADGSVNNDEGFREGTVKFIRSGDESDRFVEALSEIWLVDTPQIQFDDQAVIPLAFSSNKSQVDHSKPSTSNFKLFFDSQSDTPGEIFFTLDTYRRSIEIQEKDPKFAKTVVKSFAGKGSFSQNQE